MAARALDMVVANGRVIDGCGNPWFLADVGVRGDRVARIGPAGTLRATRVINADGRYVTPGFVDPHTHSDLGILMYRRADTAVRQGVTTHVTGNCGMSPAPLTAERRQEMLQLWDLYAFGQPAVSWSWRSFAEYLREVEAGGIGINVAPLVGHGALRICAMGFDQRSASAKELRFMAQLLKRSMVAGARGLSTGLVYPPGCYADIEEIVTLSRVVADFGGIYASHVRGERETILAAVTEAIEIGRRADVPVEVSHNAPKWGASHGASANLELIEQARRAGVDVTADNDVHTDLAPRLSRALPQPLLDLPRAELLALLGDRERREQLKADIQVDRLPGAGYAGLVKHHAWERIVVLWAPRDAALAGRSIAAIAAQRGADPFDTFFDVIVEQDDRVVAIFDYIDPADIRALLTHPLTMCSSDGLVMPPADELDDQSLYWPCSYGEYPGILERFVRDGHVLRLEEAIRKMTSFPAQRCGLFDRGVLRPGMAADICVFDLSRIRDRATNPYPHTAPFANIPPRYPEGIDYVLVNGALVVEAGEHTGVLAGRVLRRGSA